MQPGEDFTFLNFWGTYRNQFFMLTISIFTVNLKKKHSYTKKLRAHRFKNLRAEFTRGHRHLVSITETSRLML
jgi:hypothetical protein